MKRKLFSILCLFTFLFPLSLMAQEPYAVLSGGDTNGLTLTFYYDENKGMYPAVMDVGAYESDTDRPWHNYRNQILSVVFDESFANCTTLTSTAYWFDSFINLFYVSGLEYLNTDNVTDMRNMFSDCYYVDGLDLSHFNTSKVVNMESMFANCTGFNKLDVSGFQTANVTNMKKMFFCCSQLSELDLSSFNTANVVNMDSMFCNCYNMRTIFVGNGWTTNSLSSGNNTFGDSYQLTGGQGSTCGQGNYSAEYAHIDGGENNPGFLTDINSELLYVVLSDNDTVLTFFYDTNRGNHPNSMGVWEFWESSERPWESYAEGIQTVVFDPSMANCTSLTSTAGWFSMFFSLNTITGLEYLRTDNVRRMSEMFMECTNLTSLDLTHFRTENVEDMMYMFAQCTGLTTLDLSSFVTTSLEEMGYMFSGCKNLTTVYVGEGWVMTEEMSGEDMFTDCESIKGGQGTEFTPNGIAYNYAHIDGGPNNPGYFTEKKNPELYAVLSVSETNNDRTLTFFYDINKDAYRTVMSVEPFESDANVSWRDYRGTIKTVVFDPSMENCSTITSTAYWFYGFDNLSSITGMEYLKTDNVTDMAGMFSWCTNLTSIDVTGFNTSSVVDMSYMFGDCRSLTNLNLNNFQTGNVRNMSGMFAECLVLTSLDLIHFNTANVTDMTRMFDRCYELGSLNISGFNTSNVTSMSGMFELCSKLPSLDLSSFNTANVIDMSVMFYGCSGLTNLDLSSFATEKLQSCGQMFYGCSSLSTIYVGKEWNTDAVENGDNLFTNCINLVGGRGTQYTQEHTGVEYAHDDGGENNPGYLTDKEALAAWKDRLNEQLAIIYEQVEELEELMQSKDPNHVATELWQSIESLKDGIVYVSEMLQNAETGSDLEDCEWNIPELEERLAALREEVENYGIEPEPYAVLSDNNTVLTFYYDTNKAAREGMSVGPFLDYSQGEQREWHDNRNSIISVVFDDSFAACSTITNTAHWFDGCSNLTQIVGIHNLNTENITNMRSMFSLCSSLTSLDVSSFNTSNVNTMAYMFYCCSSLASLDLSSFNTAKVKDMSAMFDVCSALTSLDLSGFNTSSVTEMSAMFGYCSGLTTLDLNSFNTEKVVNINAMFVDCTALTNIKLNSFNTSNVTDMGDMFRGCSSLTTLDLSSFATEKLQSCGQMFYGCSRLATIYVGNDWNTVAVENGNGMFAGCTSLIGGRGTEFTREHTDVEYAHVDGGVNNPGYLTSKDDLTAWKNQLKERLGELSEQLVHMEAYMGEKDENHTATEIWQYIDDLNEDINRVGEMLQNAETGADLNDCEGRIDELTERMAFLQEMVANYVVVVPELTDPIAYGVFTNNMTMLTLYFNKDMGAHNEGIVIPWEELLNSHEMQEARNMLITINIDTSFVHNTTLKSTGYLFSGCYRLTTINGLENLVTDNMTDMREMFASCESLTVLDLSSFNTSHVTTMWGMFQGCSSLTTIIVGNGWDLSSLQDEGHEMFAGCNSLVGGMGTTYSNEHFDADYAHVDGGTANPGYLTGANGPEIAEFEVNGIFYRVHNQGEHKVTVAHVMYAQEELYLSDMVEYARTKWNVTALGEMAFADLHEVRVIGIPESIDSVSVNLFNHCPHLAAILWKAKVPLTTAAMGQFNNPNLLFYTSKTTNVPSNVTNVIDMTTYVADKIVLSDAEGGGNDFYCPEPFRVKDISYTHRYEQETKTGTCQGWESIVVPFDVQTYTHETKGEIYPFMTLLDEQIELDGDKPFWLYTFTSNDEFVEAEGIRANTPYIISMPNDSDYWDDYILRGRITFSAKNIEVYPTRQAMFIESCERVFMPNYENADYENPDMFLLNVGDAYEGHLPGSVFSSERPARKARPFEAYFIYMGVHPAKRYIDIFRSGVNAIREIPVSVQTKEGVYDLMGRKLNKNAQLPKGIYIIDGKKMMVK